MSSYFLPLIVVAESRTTLISDPDPQHCTVMLSCYEYKFRVHIRLTADTKNNAMKIMKDIYIAEKGS